ncbi:hypothetical protein B0T20DRAFT_453320 [Sordaria brevicollis]|uniref:Zn(2)-C6 fungal-type domain-containing protein n=1 Tax=Sordaria brevicollis TaxID=83679 RepID=A0AAE0UC18_SORBR|nr:hypothetical protein B0T20DRAFT_453320 [Sordaria brevicollis]
MEDSGAAEEQAQQPNINAHDETQPRSQTMTPSAQNSNHPSPVPQQQQQQGGPSVTTPASGPAPGPSVSTPGPPPSDTGADAGSEPVNPRKRKKASRACDFCHINHQPCDNGQPKCSVCTKHNKPCLYLRPTKRRGPQKGYRTALNTYKESAAAWGAVLSAMPGLDALIENHLKAAGTQGKQIIASIKDANAQEGLIATWQRSGVFKAFFGAGVRPGLPGTGVNGNEGTPVPEQGQNGGEQEDEEMGGVTASPNLAAQVGGRGGGQQPPAKRFARETEQRKQVARDLAQVQQQQQQQQQQSTATGTGGGVKGQSISPTESPGPSIPPPQPLLQPATATATTVPPTAPTIPTSRPGQSTGISAFNTAAPKFTINDSTLSDIVAKDAAQSSSRESQTLRPLGFAPDETIADFYSMGSNPDLIPTNTSSSDLFGLSNNNNHHHNNNTRNSVAGSGSGIGGGYATNGAGAAYDGSGGNAEDDDFLFDSEQRAYYELLMGRSFM